MLFPEWIDALRESELSAKPAGCTNLDVNPLEVSEVDTDAPLVAVHPSEQLAVRPHYYLNGLSGASDSIMVREPLIERLNRAATKLPRGFTLLVLDGWRSEGFQRAVYRRISLTAQAGGNRCDPSTFAFDMDRKGVAMQYPTEDAPHRTGGAVDVALLGPDGRDWPMGTLFDATSPESATRALEDNPDSSDSAALIGRRVLYHAMAAAEFSNYPMEWWHFDFGTAFWRFFGHLPAGPVFRTVW